MRGRLNRVKFPSLYAPLLASLFVDLVPAARATLVADQSRHSFDTALLIISGLPVLRTVPAPRENRKDTPSKRKIPSAFSFFFRESRRDSSFFDRVSGCCASIIFRANRRVNFHPSHWQISLNRLTRSVSKPQPRDREREREFKFRRKSNRALPRVLIKLPFVISPSIISERLLSPQISPRKFYLSQLS